MTCSARSSSLNRDTKKDPSHMARVPRNYAAPSRSVNVTVTISGSTHEWPVPPRVVYENVMRLARRIVIGPAHEPLAKIGAAPRLVEAKQKEILPLRLRA